MQTEYIFLLAAIGALLYFFYTNVQSDLDEVKDSVTKQARRIAYENRSYYYPSQRYYYYPSRYSYGYPSYYGGYSDKMMYNS